MRKFKIFRRKNFLSFIFTFLGITAISGVIVSCAVVPIKKEQFGGNKKTNLLGLSSDPNNLYNKIYNLSFSFQIDNTGGKELNGSTNPQTSNFGTGWLFDWKLNSDITPDNNGNINFVGYFATNLHVANLLLNPNDYPDYVASWLKGEDLTGFNKTQNFYLGRFDITNNKDLDSKDNDSNISYYELPTIPKTIYTATDFINFTASNVSSPTYEENRPYVDFAILEIPFTYYKNPDPTQLIANEVYENWIIPAIKEIKESGATYESLFNYTNYLSDNGPPVAFPQDIYIGGYPFYPWTNDQPISDPYYIEQRKTSFRRGSSAWTINSDIGTSNDHGQISKADSIAQSWVIESGRRNDFAFYLANSIPKSNGIIQSYHGKNYKQYGLVYIIDNSNLRSGASGSLSFFPDTSNNLGAKVLGIYFGTVTTIASDGNSTGNVVESTSGLVADLILPTNDSAFLNGVGMVPYDLIAGNNGNNIRSMNPNSSYRDRLATNKISSYLFPLVSDLS